MENFKFRAGQASSINQYKNTRSKLLKMLCKYLFQQAMSCKENHPQLCQNKSPEHLSYSKAQTNRIKDEISPDIYIPSYMNNILC